MWHLTQRRLFCFRARVPRVRRGARGSLGRLRTNFCEQLIKTDTRTVFYPGDVYGCCFFKTLGVASRTECVSRSWSDSHPAYLRYFFPGDQIQTKERDVLAIGIGRWPRIGILRWISDFSFRVRMICERLEELIANRTVIARVMRSGFLSHRCT